MEQFASFFFGVQLLGISLDDAALEMSQADFTSVLPFRMTNLQVGCEARELVGKDTDGVRFKFSDYPGKHVIVIFSGGWCHACHGLLPLMNLAAAQLKDKNALADNQVTFRKVIDNTRSGSNSSPFNLRNVPTLHMIDSKGAISIKNSSLDAMIARINKSKSCVWTGPKSPKMPGSTCTLSAIQMVQKY